MGRTSVSRRHGIWVTLLTLAVLVGCSSTKEAEKQARGFRSCRRVRPMIARSAISTTSSRRAHSTSLQEAININPSNAIYRDTLGVVLLELGRPDMALEHFKKAIELNPMYADAHFHMGTALAESRRWEEAVVSLPEGARAAHPHDPRDREPEPWSCSVPPKEVSRGRADVAVRDQPRSQDANRLLQSRPRFHRRESPGRGQGGVPSGPPSSGPTPRWARRPAIG